MKVFATLVSVLLAQDYDYNYQDDQVDLVAGSIDERGKKNKNKNQQYSQPTAAPYVEPTITPSLGFNSGKKCH